MNKFGKMGQVALFALISSFASAQFNASFAGPLNSDGPIGDAGNSSFTATYSGASTLFGNVNFSGDLTDGGVGSFKSEARFNITNLNLASSAAFQPTTGSTWSGTVNVASAASALVWANSGDQFKFESFESFNDAGLDATWTNVNFNFNGGPTIIDGGSYAYGTSFVFDTEGTTAGADTEVALYTSAGSFLGTDDDSGTGNLSLLNSGVLGVGTYYYLAGAYNSGFANGFAFGGAGTVASMNMNINGVSKYTGVHAQNGFEVVSFRVVPEPASLLTLGLGAVAMMRRRKA